MSAISAKDVKKLRDVTGAGMMDCKKALIESNGDMDSAIEFLRKKGQKLSDKRADRDAKEGCVLAKVSADGSKGVVVRLSCETDFVSKNEDFVAMTDKITQLALDTFPADSDANYDCSWNVYPFFESQNIVISGTNGFTLVRESGLNNVDFKANDFNLIPNPAKNNLRVQSKNSPISKVEIFNVLGQRVVSIDSDNLLSKNIDISSLNVGIYLVKINSSTTKRLIVK